MYSDLRAVKDTQLDLKENIACKDDILKAYKGIRHEYNNMLQNILCFIEEEDWKSLKDYKGKLLEKTQIMNRDNLTQLVKIKDKKILNLVYKILIDCRNNGITIYLTLYNDINCHKIQSYKQLEEQLNTAYETALKVGGLLNLKINENEEGICFAFENSYMPENSSNVSELLNTKRKPKNKNIFLNTFMKNDSLTQEILILLCRNS